MDFLALCHARTSCRAYRADPVPRAHLDRMLEAARLAPSACNRQPWRFAIVLARARREALLSRGLLPGIRMPWAGGAPALIAVGLRRETVTHRVAPLFSGVDYPLLDLGIAGEHLVLQAAELGLGTCWIGWIRPRAIRRELGWPAAVAPVALITVGWPAEPAPGGERPRRPRSETELWVE